MIALSCFCVSWTHENLCLFVKMHFIFRVTKSSMSVDPLRDSVPQTPLHLDLHFSHRSVAPSVLQVDQTINSLLDVDWIVEGITPVWHPSSLHNSQLFAPAFQLSSLNWQFQLFANTALTQLGVSMQCTLYSLLRNVVCVSSCRCSSRR